MTPDSRQGDRSGQDGGRGREGVGGKKGMREEERTGGRGGRQKGGRDKGERVKHSSAKITG